jgi:hypothetical protein
MTLHVIKSQLYDYIDMPFKFTDLIFLMIHGSHGWFKLYSNGNIFYLRTRHMYILE